MNRITFYTANGSNAPTLALREAKLILLGMFGGATIQTGAGIWRACDDCKIEEESSLVITVIAECSTYSAKYQASEVAKRLRAVFAQEEVLWTVETLDHIGRTKGPKPPTLAKSAADAIASLFKPMYDKACCIIPPGL